MSGSSRLWVSGVLARGVLFYHVIGRSVNVCHSDFHRRRRRPWSSQPEAHSMPRCQAI